VRQDFSHRQLRHAISHAGRGALATTFFPTRASSGIGEHAKGDQAIARGTIAPTQFACTMLYSIEGRHV